MNYKRLISVLLVSLLVFCMFPVNSFASDPSPSMNPKQANGLYEGLIDGFKRTDLSDELKEIDFDNSLLCGVYDWSRAWLIVSLCSDLKDNDQSLYDKYASKASKFYMALIPPLFSKDDPYSYQIMLLDGTNALVFHYTPGLKSCSYNEYSNVGQENIENMSTLASIVWEVTEDDFDAMNKIIKSKSTTTAKESDNSLTLPEPTPILTRSEIENKVLMALVFTLMYSGNYNNYNVDASQAHIDSIIETSDGWDVEGTVILYDYRNNSSSHTFRTHVDLSGSAYIPKIS